MKRLVYSPKILAYVKADSGVYDLSPYITDFGIDRKVNQVSTAQISFRNPNKKWTEHTYWDPIAKEHMVGPIFHPMDPITIILTRLQNRPVQVFTGYCDSTPYLQLFPGTVKIKASCTLKKLLYTYFDSGLPFFWEFLNQYGWSPNPETGGIVSPKAEQTNIQHPNETKAGIQYGDSGIGELLYGVLHDIGGWPDSTIYIEEMPKSVIDLVSNLFELFKDTSEESQGELKQFLNKIIGSASLGSGGGEPIGNAGGAGPEPESIVSPVDVGRAMLTAKFPTDREVLAQGMAVVSIECNFGKYAPMCWEPNSANCCGYFQIQLTHPGATVAKTNDLVECSKLAYTLWHACGGSFKCDWYNFEGSASSEAQEWQQYLSAADKALKAGPFEANTGTAQGKVHR